MLGSVCGLGVYRWGTVREVQGKGPIRKSSVGACASEEHAEPVHLWELEETLARGLSALREEAKKSVV